MAPLAAEERLAQRPHPRAIALPLGAMVLQDLAQLISLEPPPMIQQLPGLLLLDDLRDVI